MAFVIDVEEYRHFTSVLKAKCEINKIRHGNSDYGKRK